jgi:hypothetical protein
VNKGSDIVVLGVHPEIIDMNDVIYRVITKEMTEIKHVLLSHGVT